MKDFTEISSKDNSVFKLLSMLCDSSKKRQKEGLFVIEGLRICTDAYDNNVKIKWLIVSKNGLQKYSDDIEKFSAVSEKCCILSDDLFKKISDTVSPQGIIMIGEIPENPAFTNKSGRYVALENLQDPSNLGAVARTAEALGINGIIITGDSCDPYSPKALRASMGTLLRLPLYITDDIIEFSKKNGLRTVSCVVDKTAENISNFVFMNGDVLLIGNEGNGLTDETKKKSDRLITIRMRGRAESLNASNAAAIAMWEMCKKR